MSVKLNQQKKQRVTPEVELEMAKEQLEIAKNTIVQIAVHRQEAEMAFESEQRAFNGQIAVWKNQHEKNVSNIMTLQNRIQELEAQLGVTDEEEAPEEEHPEGVNGDDDKPAAPSKVTKLQSRAAEKKKAAPPPKSKGKR